MPHVDTRQTEELMVGAAQDTSASLYPADNAGQFRAAYTLSLEILLTINKTCANMSWKHQYICYL